MKYKNKIIALTTIHGKEKAIAPSIKKILKASICKINHDTDLLGTFYDFFSGCGDGSSISLSYSSSRISLPNKDKCIRLKATSISLVVT